MSNPWMISVSILFTLFVPSFSNTVPPGLNLKPAKALNQEDAGTETPPNLSLRSRMMAALNTPTSKPEKFDAPLILQKSKKKQPMSRTLFRPVVKANIETQQKTTKKPLPNITENNSTTLELNVNPVLKTNFVDSKGRVIHNVKVIPIRLDTKQALSPHPVPSGTSSLVENSDTSKPVEIKFGQATPVF